jgi:hypothetical protein
MSSQILQRLDMLASQQNQLTKALARLVAAMERSASARTADDDGWTRLPRPGARCPVSGWSRSTVLRHIAAGAVRTKIVGGSRYYALIDISKLIDQ